MTQPASQQDSSDRPDSTADEDAPQKKLLTKLQAKIDAHKVLDPFREHIEYLCVVDILTELWQ